MQPYTTIARVPHITTLPISPQLHGLFLIFLIYLCVGMRGRDPRSIFRKRWSFPLLSYPPNCRRFLQCLCITTLPPLPSLLLCCFASLLHIITYSNGPTIWTFFVDQNPLSAVPVMDTSPCYLLVVAPTNPYSPCDMNIWFATCLCFFPCFFVFPPYMRLYAFSLSKVVCLLRSRFYRCCLFS